MTTFITEEVGIAHPGQESGLPWIDEKPASVIPRDVLDAFLAQDGPRLQGFVTRVRPLVEPLYAVADERERPSSAIVNTREGDALASARGLLADYGPQFRPWSYRTLGGKTLWGLHFESLEERIAVELFELYALRPRLRRCSLCRRVFVPRKSGESTCRSYLWQDGIPEAIELCIPAEEVEALNNKRRMAGDHEKARRRLWTRQRRALEAAGGNEQNPRFVRARKEFEDYKKMHPQKFGPQERPMPESDEGDVRRGA